MKKTPKIQDDSSASLKFPPTPTDRMMATGAVAANMKPINPLAAYSGLKSANS